ncbi:MAG: T9SS type B sorting domain-containing protein [Clostridia bacterium]|nr:T9SS type B sorting domain-containing protein [Clostridia bacterium]
MNPKKVVFLCAIACVFVFFPISVFSVNSDNYLAKTYSGFIENQGQFKHFDDAKFLLRTDDMSVWFMSDRVVFLSEEVKNTPNAMSIAERQKGNDNLADKLSAQTLVKRFDLIFVDAQQDIQIVGENVYDYSWDFYLSHCPDGIKEVKSFENVRYEEIYPGIDLVFNFQDNILKYEFEVSPFSNISDIKFAWEGVENLKMTPNGDIQFNFGSLIVKDQKPISYSSNTEVETSYVLNGNQVSFDIASYNTSEKLIIDPGIVWFSSLEYNGYGHWGGVTANSIGEFYYVDWDWDPQLADIDNYLAEAGTSATFGSDAGNQDIIISKFDQTGNLLWACQYGGSGSDEVNGAVAVDDLDNLYIVGTTAKEFSMGTNDLPLQVLAGAFNQAWDGTCAIGTRGYLLKFLPNNTRQWCTFLDKGANLEVFDIACGLNNDMYLVGKSGSNTSCAVSIPTGTGYLGVPTDASSSHNFILRLNSSGALVWSTWVPGATNSTGRLCDVAIDKSNGDVLVVGDEVWSATQNFANAIISATLNYQGKNDMFYFKFNSANQPVPAWGNYIGGAGFDKINVGAANGDTEIDANGNLYVCGHTYSANFPVVDPGGCSYFDGIINDGAGITLNEAAKQDGYLFKINTIGNIPYCTFFGGAEYTSMKQLKKDSHSNLWICGEQKASGLPTINHNDYYNNNIIGTSNNIMFSQLTIDDNMQWLSYFGSVDYASYGGFDVFEIDAENLNLYLAGDFNDMANVGAGYQYASTACSGAAIFNHFLSAFEPDTIIPNVASDCTIDELTVSGTLPAGATWNWYTGGCGSVHIGTGPTVSINPTATTTYYVQAEGACIVSNCAEITIEPPVPPTITVDYSTICAGDNATLTAETGFVNYYWSTTETTPSITVSPSVNTTYSLTVTDLNGCVAEVSADITVNPIPAATASNGGPYCSGNDIDLTAGTVAGATYAWDGPNGFMSSSQNPIITNCEVVDGGVYTVTVTANSCTNTASTSVTVNPGPISSASNDGPYCEGDDINLFADNVLGATYLWEGPGAFTSSQEDPIIGSCSITNAGTYILTVSLGACSTTYFTVVSISETPVAVASSNSQICVGQDLLLTTPNVSGATYSWTGPNGFTASIQSPVILSSTDLATGSYNLTVTVGSCSNYSSTNVVVNPSPEFLLSEGSQPLCNGDSNGEINVNISAGTPDYTIDWGSGSMISSLSSNTISGLSAGTISVTVTDDNLCSVNNSFVLSEPLVLTSTIVAQNDQNCATPGNATVIGENGTSPYTYYWPSNAGSVSNNSAADLTSGIYDVTIVDNNSCETIQPVTINDAGAMSAITNILNHVSCYGENDAEVSIEITGGTPDFVFTSGSETYTSSSTINSFNNLSAGNYSITITDDAGCTSIQDFLIIEPAQITTSISSQTNQICTSPGSATIEALNGVAPYVYNWPTTAGGVVEGTATSLLAGNYDVTVVDNNLCSVVQTVSISETGNIVANIIETSQPLCYNGNDGFVVFEVSTGTPDYTYDWGETPFVTPNAIDTVEMLNSGTYNITVTDAYGCSTDFSVVIDNPVELNHTVNIVNSVSCNGYSDGEIEIIPFGGLSPFLITWNNSEISGFIPDNLSAGNYQYTITDNNLCETTGDIDISEPNVLSATESVSVPNCSGDPGQVVVTPQGGTSSYSIIWEDGSTDFTNSNIPVTTNFAYTIIDEHSCVYTNDVYVDAAPIFEVIAAATDISCYNENNGSAEVSSITGGLPQLSYLWSNGENTPQIQNLSPGTYRISVSDANNCVATDDVLVAEPEEIQLDIQATNALCSGVPGSVIVNATGGVGTLSYLWSMNGETTSSVGAVEPGIHSVSVTDANNCGADASVEVLTSGTITAEIILTQDILCNGEANGILEAVTTSENSPFSYNWSNGFNSQVISSLSAGDYQLTITDAWGCQGYDAHNLTEPNPIVVNADIVNVACYGDSTGSILLNPSGGLQPYSYLWANGSTSSYRNNIPAGSYFVTITDENLCQKVETIQITQSDYSLDIEAEVVNVKCFGQNNGEIHLVAIGGTPPVDYSVNGESYNYSGATHTNLSSGFYTIIATDAHGCSDKIDVTISEPAKLTARAILSHPSCYGNNDGTIFVSVNGGTFPYSYFIDGVLLGLDSLNTYRAGQYHVSVVDANLCEVDLGVVNLIDDPLVDCIRIPNAFSPNGDGVNDTWIIDNLDLFDDVHVQLFNRWGQKLAQSRDFDFEWDGIYNGKPLPTGTYLYVINIFVREPYVGTVTIVH